MLSKVKIRHDDSGGNAAWHLDHIAVAVENGETRIFPCQRWLATGVFRGVRERERETDRLREIPRKK